MASINGVTVKAMKEFVGHEGYCKQGNIYIDNKKQGFWSQDSCGGPDNFDFDTTLLMERIKDYYEKNPPLDTLKIYETDVNKINFENLPVRSFEEMFEPECIFMYELASLIELEKHFKKALKKGYSMISKLNFHNVRAPIPAHVENLVYACNEKQITETFSEFFDMYPYAYITVYKSLDDFVK